MKECNCHRGPEVKTKVMGCPPKVIQINNPQEPVLFHRVDIPAAMGDESVFPPENGLYKNVLLVYEANENAYLYNSDGIPTKLTSNIDEIRHEVEELGGQLSVETEERTAADTSLAGAIEAEATARTEAIAAEATARTEAIAAEATARTGAIAAEATARTTAIEAEATARTNAIAAEATAREAADTNLQTAISDESTARQTADTGLQSQIDTIVASSDVKDIVGTYAELQQYDTSTLGNNDIIKVLQDETHQDETTYYRWVAGTSSFTLIGEEGPYYTKAATDALLNTKANQATTYTKTETDTALATKQNVLTAGEAIDITNDVIKATNTGKIRQLTTDDFNFEHQGHGVIAAWLLPDGIYHTSTSVPTFIAQDQSVSAGQLTFIKSTYQDKAEVIAFDYSGAIVQWWRMLDGTGFTGQHILDETDIAYNLTTPTGSTKVLGASQGKILNEKIDAGLGKAKTLSAADYNINSADWGDTNPANFNAVALCRLSPGYYTIPSGVNGYVTTTRATSSSKSYLVGIQAPFGVLVAEFEMESLTGLGAEAGTFYSVAKETGVSTFSYALAAPINSLTQTSSTHPLSAKQGYVLKQLIDDLTARVAALEGN